MTAVRRSDIPRVVLDGRRAGELLADWGEAVWWLTLDMVPGPRARRYDPDPQGPTVWCDDHDRNLSVCLDELLACRGTPLLKFVDPTGDQATSHDPAALAHARYRRLIDKYRQAALALTEFIGDHRPDRFTASSPADPAEWCRSCLRVGRCAPRYRGDLCRWCYDFDLAQHQHPPVELVKAHHDGRRITDQMVNRALHSGRARDARHRPADP